MIQITEPIAIAYAAAKAHQVLGEFPDSVNMSLSGNIIKNVKGVTVPNSGVLKGIDVAAILGIVGGNADKALEVLSEITEDDIVKINFDGDKIFLDGEDVSKKIRENEISNKTSELSKKKIIRDYLVKMQREIAKDRYVVMVGRDIGQVVLKDAEYKFFLTADVNTRAMRRYKQIDDESVDFEEILEDLKLRDYNDSHRENSPLIKTDDAILIDSTDLNAEETIEKIISYIKNQYKDEFFTFPCS